MSVFRILSLIVLGYHLINLFFRCQGKSSEENFVIFVPILLFSGLCLILIWLPDTTEESAGLAMRFSRLTSTGPGGALAFLGLVLYVLGTVVGILFVRNPDFLLFLLK